MPYVYVWVLLLVVGQPRILAQGTAPLAGGSVYKIPIDKAGIYRIEGSWFTRNSAVDPTRLDRARIRLFTGDGGPLTVPGGSDGQLREIPFSIGPDENTFLGTGGYILFYAPGPDRREWNTGNGQSRYVKNIYDHLNYVFLCIDGGGGPGLPIETDDYESPEKVCNVFRSQQSIHADRVNLLGIHPVTQGSGQRWFGDEISNLGTYDLRPFFNLEGLQHGSELQLEATVAVRSAESERIALHLNDQSDASQVSSVRLGDVEAVHARVVNLELSSLTGLEQSMHIEFIKQAENARAWIDEAHLSFTKIVSASGIQNTFNTALALSQGCDGMTIENAGPGHRIWDVSRPTEPRETGFSRTGSQLVFKMDTSFQRLVVFDEGSAVPVPDGIPVESQDLDAIVDAELLIVFHPVFKVQAERLARHRSSLSGLKVEAVSVVKIYNRYSSGRQDPGAIRAFCKDLWLRNPEFRYLLLFGDASYDFRGLGSSFDNESLVPTFETAESLDPLLAFPSDDYFALLDEEQPEALAGDLDLAVGRIPVRTVQEAEGVLRKIIHYDTGKAAKGDWRLRVAFLADDEDNNLHLNDADRIAREVREAHPVYNQDKIYWDAFQQVSTPGGNRYPAAKERLNHIVNQGASVINYLGHGGPRGWSQERVLHLDDINSWSNFNRLPLIITATCSFTGFDDPGLTTAGEAALLNPSGGAIALFTTVRSVFASKNFRLTRSVFRELFEAPADEAYAIGDILVRAKNREQNINSRKFLLIGDPSMRLSIPGLTVVADKINGRETEGSTVIDTAGALDNVEVAGRIVDERGETVTSFDGELAVRVYDKSTTVKTLQNDPGSLSKSFELQQSTLFNGKVTVKNGLFSFKWIIPVDIDYRTGAIKMSFYAVNEEGRDAAGSTEKLSIGGSSGAVFDDDQGPQIRLEVNGEGPGGNLPERSPRDILRTGPNPFITAFISDDIGINLSNAGIGHEITAVIDDDRENSLFLNDRFQPRIDDFRSGLVRFQLTDLEPGIHDVTVTAFDVANNPGTASIRLEVVDEGVSFIGGLDNFPNPVSTKTAFRFNHSLGLTSFAARFEIFTMDGRLVDRIKRSVISEDGQVEGIEWDATGTATGSYIYRVVIDGGDREYFSSFKKMLILK